MKTNEHTSSDCPCVMEGPRCVTLQARDLCERLRGRPHYFTDAVARSIAEHAGKTGLVRHRFAGPGGVYAYCLELGGHLYHVPALYVVEAEQVARSMEDR